MTIEQLAAGFALTLLCNLTPVSAFASNADAVDGDTIVIGDVTYRLNGIDAPEYGQTCGVGVSEWGCGQEATAAMADLVSRQSVRCVAHSEDSYGRVIATCYAGNIDIGQEMVGRGLAWAFVRYSDIYVTAEREAKRRGLGIWSGPAIPPWEFRAERWAAAEDESPDGCPIKGNISRNGRIYHPPWSPWYSRTRINTDRGERWFCDEAEARAAGWRAPRWR
ncbi:thermonuclease family protein [Aliiroseovarius sp. YM-037]|uniref:thermonuclease family protein n=1 Tax=Aliiroseovarius sp. YM-037 TaxID=3341728 RepID=UPI003A81115D